MTESFHDAVLGLIAVLSALGIAFSLLLFALIFVLVQLRRQSAAMHGVALAWRAMEERLLAHSDLDMSKPATIQVVDLVKRYKAARKGAAVGAAAETIIQRAERAVASGRLSMPLPLGAVGGDGAMFATATGAAAPISEKMN
jgi:hypothetical protein